MVETVSISLQSAAIGRRASTDLAYGLEYYLPPINTRSISTIGKVLSSSFPFGWNTNYLPNGVGTRSRKSAKNCANQRLENGLIK